MIFLTFGAIENYIISIIKLMLLKNLYKINKDVNNVIIII